ncbi:amidophosphoribosyltransferase [Parabacteroides faecis]|uniref:amidophosphoribosyltransferase n=1 Tax=Parabacteroides faecis TaxID=1217282 RepID=UPI0021644B1B|nr:amidophosphoribosyltransferase [Parabacteroides faecis]MCS2894060.1 amidophosphoribosyltransferase [Parabacteroides faecis]UVQ47352.1 amidophosphoribosyltransferase [Parabacteroides faecis]
MEQLKHECGVAMVRLLKPLEYYHQKYGTWMYGLNKLYLLMEKQHNRGQEGAGLACVKLEATPGEEYMFRERALGTGAITEIFAAVHEHYKDLPPGKLNDPLFAKSNLPFAGELYMGHLRYSTTGKSGISYVHPFLRRNNWRAKNLALCGNFNLTNVNDIFKEITAIGQHPRKFADTYIMLEQMGHRLDREIERLYQKYEDEGMKGMDITHAIEAHVDLSNVLKRCVPTWDGGFVICGLTGSGESFSVRDPWGIRPAFYYADDEIVVLASERPVIQTAMNVQAEDIKELQRGEAMFISKDGRFRTSQIVEPKVNKACSFERIYFSRGSDVDIYRERKKLGENLVHPILKAVDYDLKHTVFSFIPNTAEVAYFGMQEGLNNYLNKLKKEWIADRSHLLQEEELDQILSMRVRAEKVAIKDIKLRTFIAEGNSRNDLAAHVYDVTYGSIEPFVDNLVVIDDSIVRGTTLKQSIIGILDRLHPRKIVIVSSSPQVRYPDYYGIDMSRMNEFIAFRAAVALLKERGMESVITDAYWKAKKQQAQEDGTIVNFVKEIYAPFTDEEISGKMVDLLTPAGTRAKVEIVYQTLDGLHVSCPNHPGDWYFSGDYPTPGGARMVNKAFINYMEEEYLIR